MAPGHITDDDLEMYALDRLDDAVPVSDQLPVCKEFRARLAGWDDYMEAMLATMRREVKASPREVG